VYQRPTVDVIARALETAGFQSIDENGAAAEKATTEEEVITENSQNEPNLKPNLSTSAAIGHSSIEFIDENGGGPGVPLRKRHQKKS